MLWPNEPPNDSARPAVPARSVAVPIALGLLLLCSGCLVRNAIWSKPVLRDFPVALSSDSITTNTFHLPAHRYDVYLCHQEPCSLMQRRPEEGMPVSTSVACDINVKISRGPRGCPVVFEQHTTKAGLMSFGATHANYDLGYFELASGGEFTMVISNAPSQHNDTVCHARVEVREILPK
jgi:hypothetical protein